jgi:hypothetical protein
MRTYNNYETKQDHRPQHNNGKRHNDHLRRKKERRE